MNIDRKKVKKRRKHDDNSIVGKKETEPFFLYYTNVTGKKYPSPALWV